LKKVLIISPYFPPVNAADMQRVRMSLPYFAGYGWEAEVVCIDPVYTDVAKDELLLESLPPDIMIHKVKALNKKWTSKIGLGSIALRSLWYYRKKVNELLKAAPYDLIYFSTTQFPVCVLGAYWKKKFGVRYVIDMQDPWHSDYYRDKQRSRRPPKYWFSYRLNKYLEPIAVKNAGGLISVSEDYITALKKRYPQIAGIPSETIPFGAFEPDFNVADKHAGSFVPLLKTGYKNIVYIGRGGNDMYKAIIPLFEAYREGLMADRAAFEQLKFYFIGTSYAPAGQGIPTIMPLAKTYGIEGHVTEIIDRISYYHTLATLQQADALFIPGSDDPQYTASKIFPYLLTRKPLLAIFNKASSAIKILQEYGVKDVYDYESVVKEDIISFFKNLLSEDLTAGDYNPNAIEKYSARQMTLKQCLLFEKIVAI
jgi:hypothetical protein